MEFIISNIGFYPFLFYFLLLIVGFYFYFKIDFKINLAFEEKEKNKEKLLFKLIIIAVIFKFLYSKILTVAQYFIWKSSNFSRFFLEQGLVDKNSIFSLLLRKKGGYFIYYSFTRFWLNFFVSLLLAFLFYLFLKFLRKINSRFLSKSDLLLAYLTAFSSGWPGFILFLILFLFIFLILGIFNNFLRKEKVYTTLDLPFWIAAFFVTSPLGYFLLENFILLKVLYLGI